MHTNNKIFASLNLTTSITIKFSIVIVNSNKLVIIVSF